MDSVLTYVWYSVRFCSLRSGHRCGAHVGLSHFQGGGGGGTMVELVVTGSNYRRVVRSIKH